MSKLAANPDLAALLQQTILVNRRAGMMFVTRYESDIDFLDIAIDPPAESNVFRLEIGLMTKRLQVGSFKGSVVLHTNDPQWPEIIVPVSAVVTD